MILAHKLNEEYLKLAKIVYGGKFYLELKNYKIKDLDLSNTKFQKVTDTLLSKEKNNKFYSYKKQDSGFCANLFEHIKTKKLVLAFRGTERIGFGENISDLSAFMRDVKADVNLMTGIIDEQFVDAWHFYKLVKKQYPKFRIIIVGQSLGGALAQLVSAKEYTINRKQIETYSYNSPGCRHLLDEFDCNITYDYSFVTNYSVMNDWCGMFGEHIGKRYLIAPIKIKPTKKDAHAEVLNNILLSTHEGIFEYTKAIMGKVIEKPKDFNQEEGLSLWYFDENNPIREFKSISDFTKLTIPNFNVIETDFMVESMQNAKKFLEEKSPEILKVATTIKNATDNFIQEQKEQTEKIMNNLNNNPLSNAIKLLDNTIAKLSIDTLNKAKMIVEKNYKIKL